MGTSKWRAARCIILPECCVNVVSALIRMRIAFLSGLNMSRQWKEMLFPPWTINKNDCCCRDCLCWRLHFGSVLQNWAGMRCPYKLLRMILALVCSKLSRLTLDAPSFCSHCWICSHLITQQRVQPFIFSTLLAAHTLTVQPQCSSCEAEFANLNRLATPAISVCCLRAWGCRIGHVALFCFF